MNHQPLFRVEWDFGKVSDSELVAYCYWECAQK